MKNFFRFIAVCLSNFFDAKSEFGMTVFQTENLLALARQGEVGRDIAEQVACTGYGMRTSEFYRFLSMNGIACQ